jgi:hypothetical protein
MCIQVEFAFRYRFDFGTGGPTKGTPFVQMLSTTDPTKSTADHINVRRQNMASLPPELAPADLVKVMNGQLAAKDAVPVTTAPPSSSTSSGGRQKSSGISIFKPASMQMSVVGAVVLLALMSFF